MCTSHASGSWGGDCLHFITMRNGSQDEGYMNQLSIQGKVSIFRPSITTSIVCTISESHLKGLLPKFCKSVDLFLDKLTPLADGRTKVPMKTHMRDAMLDVISKVGGGAALFHDIVALRISPQVMFSSDFTTKWRGKCSTVKEQGLGSLTEQAFKGIEISRLYPLFKVSMRIHIQQYTISNVYHCTCKHLTLHVNTCTNTQLHSCITQTFTTTHSNTHWANVDQIDHHYHD